MNELQFLTDGNELNHSYTIESAAINGTDLVIVVKENEEDEFLRNFYQGKTSYRIVVNTDVAEIRVKHRVSSRNFLSASNGNDNLISFIIDLTLKN